MRKYFITGLLVLVPFAITLWVLSLMIGILDQSLLLLPQAWRPENVFGFHIPGLGAILMLVVVLITGLLFQNYVGKRIFLMGGKILRRIPLVSPIYSSVKQVSDTLFSSSGNAFRQAVLLQYPRPGIWTIGFITGIPQGEVSRHLPGDFVSIYLPTTPNPTSGFFLILARTDIIELDMNIDVALKYVLSMGVVAPTPLQKTDFNSDSNSDSN